MPSARARQPCDAIEGLQLIRRDGEECGERCFERPLAALVVQGSKHSMFGDREYAYGENQCLVAGVDMPSQFNAVAATPEKPFLSLCLYLDQRTVSELCVEMAREGVPDSVECCGVAVADAGADLLGCMLRLVELLDKPEQIPFRAPLILRELHYLLLTGRREACCASSIRSARITIRWCRPYPG